MCDLVIALRRLIGVTVKLRESVQNLLAAKNLDLAQMSGTAVIFIFQPIGKISFPLIIFTANFIKMVVTYLWSLEYQIEVCIFFIY